MADTRPWHLHKPMQHKIFYCRSLYSSIRCIIRKWLRVCSTKLSLVESGESDTNGIRDVAVHVFADLARSSTRMKMDRVLLEPVRHGLDDSDWAPQSIASGAMGPSLLSGLEIGDGTDRRHVIFHLEFLAMSRGLICCMLCDF